MAWPETYKCFVFTQQQRRIHIVHLLPRPIYTKASKGNSFITNYIHCPKAQAWSPSNVHKTPNSNIQPSSPATNRTTPHYILPRSFPSASLLFSFSCCPKFFSPVRLPDPFSFTHPPTIHSSCSSPQTSVTDLRYSSKPTLPIRATPSLIIRRRQSASTPI